MYTLPCVCADYAMKYRTGLDATTDELLGIYRYTSASKVIKRDSYHVFIDNLVDGRAFLLVADRFDESLLVLGKLLRMSVDQLRYYSHKVSYHHSNDELPYRYVHICSNKFIYIPAIFMF